MECEIIREFHGLTLLALLKFKILRLTGQAPRCCSVPFLARVVVERTASRGHIRIRLGYRREKIETFAAFGTCYGDEEQ